jgi:galacturan 1,4-alpha-galacturonidase
MRFQLASALTIVSATLAIASPTWLGERDLMVRGDDSADRPTVTCSPHQPRLPKPTHPPRGKVCRVRCYNNGQDDSPAILEAVQDCNNGGRILFKEDCNYTVGTALDLSNLKHVDLGMKVYHYLQNVSLTSDADIRGHIKFTNDTTYWQAHSFKFVFQNATSFWQIGGEDVAIYVGLLSS